MRLNAVVIMDSLGFHDRELDSVLGRHDGLVYENLLKWAKEQPINQTNVKNRYRNLIPLEETTKTL